jgi:hypothetical protein
VLLLVFLTAAPPRPEALAETPSEPSRAQKSVRGTLQSIDKSLNGLFIKSDAGQRMAWQFDPKVLAEIAKFPKGAPIIVIYRQISSNEKRVTAVAFPGTAEKPTYTNMTGERVLLRSAPAVADACSATDPATATDVTIPTAGRAEVLDGCWCCAPIDGTCTPRTKSGQGQAFLASCFE